MNNPDEGSIEYQISLIRRIYDGLIVGFISSRELMRKNSKSVFHFSGLS